MRELLRQAELFEELGEDGIGRLATISRIRTLAAGDYLFLLGDQADYLYIVVKGKVDLCFPLVLGGVVKDIPVESATAGKTLGWSAMVKPYRFTLSARAAEPADVIGFPRHELQQVFEAAPGLGIRFLTNLSELVGIRLLTFQALWVRELQRTLVAGTQHRANPD